MHRAVVGYMYLVFVEAAEPQLLNIRRADVEMRLAILFEIHQKISPVTELTLVSIDHVFADFVAFNARRGAKRCDAISRIDSVKHHHIRNRPLGYAPGRPSPSRMNRGDRSGFGIRDQ